MAEPQYALTVMSRPSGAPATDPNSPSAVLAANSRMTKRSKLCRDLRGGSSVMLSPERIQEYLPQYPNEDTEDYGTRLKFASLRNFFDQAVTTMLGKIFSQPPVLNDDVSEDMQTMLSDADLNGNDWTVVSKDLMDAAITDGMAWNFIDYHSVDAVAAGQELTLAQEREMGVRPYWIVIPQSNVLGVRYKYDKGLYRITQFRFYQRVTEEDGLYGEKEVEYIRVVTPEYFETFKKVDKTTTWASEGRIPNTLGLVAAVPLYTKKVGAYEAAPPLENLAYMNLEHFQIRSDQRRALSVASFPLLVATGVEKSAGTIAIGPLTSIALEDPNAAVKWVESQGAHLRAGAEELDKLEAHMRTFGLSFENPGMYATATGRNIDASDAIAPLQLWAIMLKDVLEISLYYTALWLKKSSGGTINMNTAFLRNMLTVEGLKLLVEALKESAISREDFLSRMKDYGLLDKDFDPNASIEKAVKEAKALAEAMPKPEPVAAPAPGAKPKPKPKPTTAPEGE